MKHKELDWSIILFIGGYHLALLIGLPIYFMYYTPSWGLIGVSALILFISGIGITAGYHRFYSHSSYKTNSLVESIFLFLATLATQGSAIKWAHDHRKHHSFVDTERDPYSIKKGFWFAHVLWMFRKPEPMDPKIVADLYRNKLLVFQHKYYNVLMFATNGLVTLLMGWLFNDFLSALVFVWGVRLFFLHHFTWFINSLAHTWGSQKFSQEHSAVDNYIVSLFTFGEGYHNYHHTFSNDYRNGIYWFQFDPAKWLIWTLSKLGLATQLRRISKERIQEKMILERKNELLEELKHKFISNRQLIEEKLEKITHESLKKFSTFHQLNERYKAFKKEKNKSAIKEIADEVKSMKKSLNQEWKSWKKLSRELLKTSA